MNRKHYLQQDYERLIQYAKGLGMKVSHRPRTKDSGSAAWVIDGSEMIIYRRKSDSLTYAILSMIHELAHHKAFVNSGRRISNKVGEAVVDFNLDTDSNTTISKSKRRIIYEMERSDSQYQVGIWKELNLKIPQYKVMAEKDLSNISYRWYYIHGHDLTKRQQNEIRKQLRNKYKDKLC
jgi:hypothetical protein